jgi:hypothetical protein
VLIKVRPGYEDRFEMTTSAKMTFREAWKVVGNPSPGNTSWSADVDGKPVFTAWAMRDLKFDKEILAAWRLD